MISIIQSILILLPTITFGQSFLPMDTLDNYPYEINSKINQEIERVIQVDFTGDNKLDYIVQTKPDINGKTSEIWLTSEFLLFTERSYYDEEFNFIRFINRDNDPEPEVYMAVGYEDGIDYTLHDLNMKTGQMELLFYFNPIIIENEKFHWGYPWDTDGIVEWREEGLTLIYCSFDHDIVREENITYSENQKILPVIFLRGHSTQPEVTVEEIRSSTWNTLENIKKLSSTTAK